MLLQANHLFQDHIDAARYILEAGADTNLKNKRGRTPAEVYKKNKCRKYDSTSKQSQKETLMHLIKKFEVPEEILARGKEAVRVFNEELENGKITINHARLMVGGKQGVGKTSLVNTLLGKPFNDKEPSTDGIVLRTAFQATNVDCSEWEEEEDIDDCNRIKQIRDNAIEDKVAEKLKFIGKQTEEHNSAPKPAVEPVNEPAVEPVTEPATGTILEREAELMPEPAAEPISEGAVEPVTEPAAEPISEPAVEPISEQAVEPVTEPAAEPIPEPAAEPISDYCNRIKQIRDNAIEDKVAEKLKFIGKQIAAGEPIHEPAAEQIPEPTVEPVHPEFLLKFYSKRYP
ncbi:transcriptional regulatory protein AlgP-like [Anneissia japonica]|uniref:transcriptional regulatory protein AlgP-like n=1 Tax=Anneissia japonica TaxID=1529436 RepID=UPI00142597C2|nr:transcriptional regulatory protein AlgP-like [Anneissia japonica]